MDVDELALRLDVNLRSHGVCYRGAEEAKRDFASRGCRSDIFRAVLRRLARELEENTQKAPAAVWS